VGGDRYRDGDRRHRAARDGASLTHVARADFRALSRVTQLP
jgi:hypothetical protein